MLIKWSRIPKMYFSIFNATFNKLLSLFVSKYTLALMFQKKWVKEFQNNKFKVLEYWKKYRYLNEINKICNIKKDMKVLDVGCGISTVLHFIDGERYGIDPLADEYKKLYSYPAGINIQKGYGEEIPFQDKYFHIVFCSNVLDHVSDPKKTCDEIYRVLRQNGFFILTIEIFKEKTIRDPAHPHSLSKRDVHLLLKDKFEILLEKESPWIGLRNYVNGSRKSHKIELIIITKK